MQLPFSQVDEYRLQQLIYDGPNTLVYRGYQAGEQRPVLVKLLRPQATNQEERVRRFQREGRICARLKHPHIVDVYATGQEGDYHYIILEYVDGGN
ncbi:MAG: protein kinase, partial [Calditrichaeota bacterium]|nr:protein kinase [Calditrichota bacterium]